MRRLNRAYFAAMVAVPLILITGYLLWIWPRPSGTSWVAQLGPYLVSLLAGLPFALLLGRSGRPWVPVAFLIGGSVMLWIYAVVVLCWARGVCL